MKVLLVEDNPADATAHKPAEERLRESEARYRMLLEHIPQKIFTKDRNCRLLSVNESFARDFGVRPEEMVGKTNSDLFPKELADKYTADDTRVLETGQTEELEEHYVQAGRETWVNTIKTPVRDEHGEIVGLLGIFWDITERKRAEDLRARLAAIVDSASDAIITKGLDGVILTWNPAAERLFGYPAQEVIGRHIELLIPDDRKPEEAEIMERIRRSEPVQQYESVRLRKTGTPIVVSLTVSPIKDASGRVVGASKIVRDVTDRIAAQEALRRANAYNRSLIEASLDPLVTIGPDGKVTDVNAATEAATGCPRAQLIGTDFSDYFTEPAQARAGYQQVFREGSVRDYPLELRHRDGHIAPVLYNAAVYRDERGRVLGVFAAARDVTARRQAEEALRRANAYNRSLLEASLDPLVTIGPDGKVTDVNAATEAATGRPRAQLIGTDFLDYFTEPAQARAGYQQVFREGSVRDYPLDLRHRDGRVTSVLYNAAVYRDEKGKSIGVFAAARDITRRKQAEEQIRRFTEDLKRSHQELEHFAYVASHDLQEPLRVMSSFSELLAQRYRGKLDQEANEFIGFIVDGARRMQKLIEDLLTYSRVGTRGQPFKPVECEPVFEAARANLELAIAESGARLTHEPLPTVLADESQLVQLFQNLLSNALKFRPPGQPPQIQVSAAPGQTHWKLTFRDNGIGIDPQFFDRLFIIFQRLHTQDRYGGTGIGLAVCKKIVKRHGGRIWVESTLGCGSAFHFTLPAINQRPP